MIADYLIVDCCRCRRWAPRSFPASARATCWSGRVSAARRRPHGAQPASPFDHLRVHQGREVMATDRWTYPSEELGTAYPFLVALKSLDESWSPWELFMFIFRLHWRASATSSTIHNDLAFLLLFLFVLSVEFFPLLFFCAKSKLFMMHTHSYYFWLIKPYKEVRKLSVIFALAP